VSTAPALPDGFEPHFRKSPVTEPWEPLYSRPSAEGVELGLVVMAAHCNSRGFVHGGVIAALADNAMGLSYGVVRRRIGVDSATYSGAVTVSLGLDYTASAKIGQWLQITPRVIKAGRSIGFVDALVTADGDIVARASATFQLVE
jgi:acyl-coenzyme A thioesterase PaaI-like protein